MRQIKFVLSNRVFQTYLQNWFFFFMQKQPSSNISIRKSIIYASLTDVLEAHKDLFKFLCLTFFWLKIRILYYINNWIYTTNHKRIAVNYFWFVILSGIVGMVLATIIRLEFAYPGVGVLAGDSLQYLSLVTAHGVIMVFFMIMPLLLGAFANFLLPTQLGVHDVAFPRLNSAAFWFLPGGLIMLAQLVCVDRRYQRMNCFNIREIQSILKRRFFVDLINAHDHKNLLHETMVNLKFKTNDNFVNPNLLTFYNYGVEFSPKNRTLGFIFTTTNDEFYFNNFSILSRLLYLNKNNSFFIVLNKIYFTFFDFFGAHFSLISNFKFFFTSILFSLNSLTSVAAFNLFLFYDKLLNAFNSFFQTITLYFFFWFNTLYLKNKFFPFFIDAFVNLIYFSFYFTANFLQILNTFFHFFTPALLTLDAAPHRPSRLTVNVLDFFFVFNILETFYFYNYFIFRNLNIFVSFNIDLFSLLNEFLKKFALFDFNFSNLNFFYTKHIYISFYKNNTLPFFFSIDRAGVKSFYFAENALHLKNIEKFYSYRNFNSHITYLYILFHFIGQIPHFIFFFIYNIFNFKEMSILINDFGNLLTIWYIPLLVNDNIFYFIWQKINYKKIIETDSSFLNLEFLSFFKKFNLNFSLSYLFLIDSRSVVFNWIFEFFSIILSSFTILIKITTSLLFNFKNFIIFDLLHDFFYNNLFSWKNKKSPHSSLTFDSKYFDNLKTTQSALFNNEELFSAARFHRFDNPVFKYDYKSGDYYPKLYKEVYPYLFTSVIELTGGLRQAPWFFSSAYDELSIENFNFFFNNLEQLENRKWFFSRFTSLEGFYNFFFVLNFSDSFLNKRWISVSSMDQKFYKFFHTSSMQQRIYNNWRSLKFTRESWRCKLLMSRHQKTLFRRYVNEDGVFWSIERNAKDLLPGWAMITPFSSRTRFTAIGKTDIGLMGVLLVLNSSIISGANFIVTYRYLSTLNNRKMRDARSFFTEAVMVSSWMMIAANPMLVIGIIMLLSDRHWQTSFFDYSGGGDTVLFQHMFWFFGHPEVYIIILPTFGFVNTMLSYYLKKRVSARASLLYSMYTIAFLGFFVWGHHMYMVGLAHTTRMLFSTLTVMISVPAATKLMHWCVTTVNSSFAMELPLVYTLTFIFLFVSGGISGMCVAHTGMDVLFHDTFYVIGHFHVMLAGAAMIASFGAFYFYFAAIFGVKYSRIYAYLHFVYYLLGQLFTVIPMFWLGYAGMPRRVLDYPASFGGWHSVISGGHMLSVAGLIAFFIMIFDSLRQAKAATRNTFGIGRYNIRLNFYIYEIAKLNNVQEKAWSLFKFLHLYSLKLNKLNYYNLEYYETTLFSYTFSVKNKI